MEPPDVLGVVGAGVMGAGIAQLASLAGMQTLLYDSSPEALEAAVVRIARDLDRGAERGSWTPVQAVRAQAKLSPVSAAADLAPAQLVVEAVPEDLDL